jgi:hypothetical protein
MNAVELLPAVRDLFGQHPRAAYLSPEQVAGLLWILRYVFENEPPEVHEVAAALEALDIETGREAA